MSWSETTTGCDPTWEVCDAPATAPSTTPTDSTSSDTGTANTAVGVPSGGGSMFLLAHGALSAWMVVDGFLTYSGYNSFGDKLNTNNVDTKTLWTTDYIKDSEPISKWYTAAYT